MLEAISVLDFIQVFGGAGLGIGVMYLWLKHEMKQSKERLETSKEERQNEVARLTEAHNRTVELLKDRIDVIELKKEKYQNLWISLVQEREEEYSAMSAMLKKLVGSKEGQS